MKQQPGRFLAAVVLLLAAVLLQHHAAAMHNTVRVQLVNWTPTVLRRTLLICSNCQDEVLGLQKVPKDIPPYSIITFTDNGLTGWIKGSCQCNIGPTREFYVLLEWEVPSYGKSSCHVQCSKTYACNCNLKREELSGMTWYEDFSYYLWLPKNMLISVGAPGGSGGDSGSSSSGPPPKRRDSPAAAATTTKKGLPAGSEPQNIQQQQQQQHQQTVPWIDPSEERALPLIGKKFRGPFITAITEENKGALLEALAASGYDLSGVDLSLDRLAVPPSTDDEHSSSSSTNATPATAATNNPTSIQHQEASQPSHALINYSNNLVAPTLSPHAVSDSLAGIHPINNNPLGGINYNNNVVVSASSLASSANHAVDSPRSKNDNNNDHKTSNDAAVSHNSKGTAAVKGGADDGGLFDFDWGKD